MTRNHPNDAPQWDRLFRLVAGELSPEDAANVRAWADRDPERRQVLAELEEVWRVTEPSGSARPDAWDAEAELRRLRKEAKGAGSAVARIGQAVELGHGRTGGRGWWRGGPVLRMAAALALVVGGGVLWRYRARVRSGAPVAVATAEYRTAPGQRLSFGLPDGTRVVLGPASVLRRSSTDGARERAFTLEGEGYFYAKHDAAHPFVVRTARAVARDLGTRFVVRAYPDESATEVVVSDGLVAVVGNGPNAAGKSAPSDSVLLRPRQRASVSADGTLAFADGVALEPYFGLASGELAFQRAPLDEVVRRLGRWYGIDVRIGGDAPRGYRLTATFREEDAEAAVDLVATSLGLTVSRVGTAYVFGKNGR